MSSIEKTATKNVSLIMRKRRLTWFDNWLPITGLERDQLFNESLGLYAWSVEQRARGHIIASIDPETGIYQQLKMTALEEIVEPGTVLSGNDDYALVPDDPMVRIKVKIPQVALEAFDANRKHYGFTTHDDLLNRGYDTFMVVTKALSGNCRFGSIGDGLPFFATPTYLENARLWLNRLRHRIQYHIHQSSK